MKTCAIARPALSYVERCLVILGLLCVFGALRTLAQTLDGFAPDPDNMVIATAMAQGGEILAAGNFTKLGGSPCISIGRLKADGSLDTSFNAEVNGGICLASQPDGKVVVAGWLTSSAGQQQSVVARLHDDGSLDGDFTLSFDREIRALAVQADGRIVVGGYISNLVRLNVDGTVDSSFNPSVSGFVGSLNSTLVTCLLVQPDGKILVGGRFANLGGQPHSCLGRLNEDGTPDVTFDADADGAVGCLALQPDGKILVGGSFTAIAGTPCSRLARLNSSGTVDTAFGLGASSSVYSLVLQADGKFILGGSFTSLSGQSRNRIGRYDADGSLDPTFSANASGTVFTLAIQQDGGVVAGGAFTNLNGQKRYYLGRLANTEPATTKLSLDGSAINWQRGGTSPEVSRTSFEFSQDGTNWSSLGVGSRVPGGWQLKDVSVPGGGLLRARGLVTAGYDSASCWYVESVIAIPSTTPLVINSNDGYLGFASNQFGFNVSGCAGRTIVIEASSDLVSWTPLVTNSASSQMYFTDPADAGSTRRLYRARALAP